MYFLRLLMNDQNIYYQQNDRFLIAVDCIIFGFQQNQLCLLLLKRGFEPSKGEWSLAGGFLKKNESLKAAAQRVLSELTGLTNLFMEQIEAFGEMERDPGERVISAAYYALINVADYQKNLVKEFHTQWVDIKEIPKLIFDHNQMVQAALERLRQKAASQPIGFNLLPEKFTLNQLQKLYEAIYQKEFDNRNFRKRIIELGFIEKSDEKDKSTSKRGAFLYILNKKKYEKAIHEGLNFEIN